MHHTLQSLRALLSLLNSLLQFNLILTIRTFSLITIKSISSGVGFLIILPLLDLIDSGTHSTVSSQSLFSCYALFDFLHLPKTLPVVLSLFTATMCITAYIAYLEQCASQDLQQRYNQYLRTKLQQSLLFSHWSFLRLQKKSDLTHVLISETHNLTICNHQLLMLINQIFLIGINTTIALILSWSVSLFAIGAALILMVMMFPLHKKTSESSAKYLKASQSLQQIISEQLCALKMIKGSGLEAPSTRIFHAAGETLKKLNIDLGRSVSRNQLLYACCSAIFFSVLLYLAIDVYAIAFNQLLLLLLIYARILPLISSAQQAYQRIVLQVPAYEHIMQLLRETQTHQEKIDTSATITFDKTIQFHDISFKYPQSNRWIIRHMNLALMKNTSTLIIGPSGIGKTTLIDLLAALSTPTEGKIIIDDMLLSPLNAHAWRTQIAYITQEAFLFNATIRENLLGFNSAPNESELYYALELAAADFVLNLPEGLYTLIGENGTQLSGGERQRIALARAILQRPKLLILDESTNALDQDRVQHIQQSLNMLKGIMTILIISHQAIPFEMIDQVIRLDREHVLGGVEKE